MASFTAETLFHIATGHPAGEKNGMSLMVKHLTPLEGIAEALTFFQANDSQCHGIVCNVRNHHMTGMTHSKGGGRKPKFDWAGANATWRMARKKFGDIARGMGDRLSKEESARVTGNQSQQTA